MFLPLTPSRLRPIGGGLGLLLHCTALAQPWSRAEPSNFFDLPTAGQTHIRYYATHPLDRPQPQITRAIINIHGGARRGSNYFESVTASTAIAGLAETCLVITPQFRLAEDQPRSGELWWDEDGDWKVGIDSTAKLPHRVSSFTIADLLLAKLGDRRLFPNLQTVVLMGHSSGGQFTQRYAISSGAPDKLPPGVRMRFVVANPSSYCYLRPERIRPGSRYEFWIPPSDEAMTKYNTYKHGPLEPPPYFAGANWTEWADRYRQRDVIYLLGTDDIDSMHSGLDTSPGGQAQGPNRLERGRNFLAYMHKFHAPHNHVLLEVPAVGHEGPRMFSSAAGIRAIFDVIPDIRRVSDGVPAKPGGKPD